MHPRDWVEFYRSHTPYEWALQSALDHVEPGGDDRDDLRAAVNTSKIVMALSAKERSDGEVDDLVNSIARYLKCHSPPGEDEDDDG